MRRLILTLLIMAAPAMALKLSSPPSGGGLSQGTADDLYINDDGDTGTGNYQYSGGSTTYVQGTTVAAQGLTALGFGDKISTFTAAGLLQLVANSTITSNGTLTISTAASAALTGSPALFINKSGQVGLGTASPEKRLHITGTIGEQGLLFDNNVRLAWKHADNVTIRSILYLDGSDLLALTQGNNGMVIGNTGGVFHQFGTTGKVGINTVNRLPSTTLDIEGDSQFGSGATKSTFTASGGLLVVGDTTLKKFTATLAEISGGILGSGIIDVTGQAQFGASATKSSFTTTGNLQLVANSTMTGNGTLSFSTAPSAALTSIPNIFINSAGRVGIGNNATGNRALTVGAGTNSNSDSGNTVLLVTGSAETRLDVKGGTGTMTLYSDANQGVVGSIAVDGKPVHLYQNNELRATVNGVGIGIGAPNATTHKFHVSSGTVMIDGGTNAKLILSQGSTTTFRTTGEGLILTDAAGACWAYSPNTGTGAITARSVTCP